MTSAAVGGKLLESAKARGILKEAAAGIRYAYNELADKRISLTIWRGKSKRPIFRYLVESRQAGEGVVAKYVADARSWAEAAEVAKAAKAVAEAENRASHVVGAILRNSWGYDQTNIDYYEITARSTSGATVMCRPIASKLVRSTGAMSEVVGPQRGRFTGPPVKKRVTEYGVQFAHGWTRIVDDADESEASHYH